jgi:enoyl-CoA hydratase/carnithine racemase
MPQFLKVDGPADGVVWLTLDRPDKRNALSIALRDEIADALDGVATDEDVRCVVFTGSGETFCAGFDLREFENPDAEFQTQLWASSDRYHHTVLCFPLPTLAAVNGPALAGGFDLAIMCDFRIASSTARFAHPERSFGDVIYAPLHDLVGGAVARELTMGGRVIDADAALSLNVVTQVVAPNELRAAAETYAAQVAAAPRDVLARTKAKALRRAGIDPAAPTLDL